MKAAPATRSQDPQVILWDIAPPYDLNWRYFQEINHLPIMQGRTFIVTTTHVKHLREVAAESQEAIEILDKPYTWSRCSEPSSKPLLPAKVERACPRENGTPNAGKSDEKKGALYVV